MPTSHDPAPALGRGLELLRLLWQKPGATLDDLAKATGWPKSSLLRLLASLEQHGAATRDGRSGWRATVNLSGAVSGVGAEAWQGALPALANLGVRAELYRFDDDGPVLTAIAEPAGWATTGMVQTHWRPQTAEMLAPVQLWLAHRASGPPGRTWYWRERRRAWLSATVSRRLIDRARLAPLAECPARNHNALRRCAVALRGDRSVAGALVAAQVCFSAQEVVPRAVREALLKWGRTRGG